MYFNAARAAGEVGTTRLCAGVILSIIDRFAHALSDAVIEECVRKAGASR